MFWTFLCQGVLTTGSLPALPHTFLGSAAYRDLEAGRTYSQDSAQVGIRHVGTFWWEHGHYSMFFLFVPLGTVRLGRALLLQEARDLHRG